MIGEEAAPAWLETRWILAAFGQTEEEAVPGYVRFVAEGEGPPSPWEQLKQQVFLASDAFVESMRRKVPEGRDMREIPRTKARVIAEPLSYYAHQHANRNRAITAAYASGGYTMQNISDFFGLHYFRVSKIIHAVDQARARATAQGKT